MKKVISIAVSSLLLSNISFAQTANADNSILQSIQQKIDAKKSGLGSHVQTNSGLSGLSNKSSTKDMSEIAKSVNVAPDTTQTTMTKTTETVIKEDNKSSGKTVIKNTDNKVHTTTISPVDVKEVKEIKEVKEVKSQSNVSFDNTTVKELPKKNEICEPVKHTIHKKPVQKAVIKKTVIKKTVVNNFDMVKTQNYTPVDFSQKNKWILNSQVNASIKDNASHIEVTLSDKNGQVIPKEQFNKDFIRVVQISNNFKSINHQEENMNFVDTSYMFNKSENNCSAIFVQYHLKSSAIPTTLVKYISNEGALRDNIDSSCPQAIPEDISTNVNYSVSNNISGLIFKDNKLISSKPVSFNIIFSKDGVTKIPNDLFVYAIKNDFSDLTVFEPKNYGHASSGIAFEQNLAKGQYVLGYSFKEGKKEDYFKNINVQ